MRGLLRKFLGLGLLSLMLATPVILAQRPGGGRKGGSHKGGSKKGGRGGKMPTKGGRGGN